MTIALGNRDVRTHGSASISGAASDGRMVVTGW
jgi:hypothetical protein